MKRILVTGGAGFIGSHICEKLLCYENVKVICLDNLFSSSTSNISHLYGGRFEFIRGDVCSPFEIDCDEIYHLACPASPVHYQKNPVKTIKTAFIGTLNALECARNNGAKIVITSTSEIYGDPLVHPQVESYFGNVNPIGSRSCYDEGKRAAESLAVSWSNQYGVSVRIARLFNTYGPRMAENDGRVIPNFITQGRNGKNLTIHGNGKQTRSFCYISDTVHALNELMKVDVDGFVVVNIGNPEEKTILEVADIIAKWYCVGIKFIDIPDDDPKKRKPNIRKAKKLLNWNPVVKFNNGIIHTINYFNGTK